MSPTPIFIDWESETDEKYSKSNSIAFSTILYRNLLKEEITCLMAIIEMRHRRSIQMHVCRYVCCIHIHTTREAEPKTSTKYSTNHNRLIIIMMPLHNYRKIFEWAILIIVATPCCWFIFIFRFHYIFSSVLQFFLCIFFFLLLHRYCFPPPSHLISLKRCFSFHYRYYQHDIRIIANRNDVSHFYVRFCFDLTSLSVFSLSLWREKKRITLKKHTHKHTY